jgi:hypothetical protein
MMQKTLNTNMGSYSSTHLTRISTPRFLDKKRGKGYTSLQRSSQAHDDLFFFEEVDPHHHEASFSSFVLKERGTNPGKMDLLKDGVPQSQLMKRMFHKHILS